MKYTLTLFSIIIFSIILISCRKGCTDCNAINYDSKAKRDDNSCQYVNDHALGIYFISDSILVPPTVEWINRTYYIQIKRTDCSPNHVILLNYANNTDDFVGDFDVECLVENNEITVLDQNVNGIEVSNTSGYFTNDSIYFEFFYLSELGDPYYGQCYGVKL